MATPDEIFDEADADAVFDAAPESGDAAPDTGAPGSPLEKALKEQAGGVITVETPTGAAQFDRMGRRVLSSSEAAQQMDAGQSKLKERALEEGLTFLSSGGKLLDEMKGAGDAYNAFPQWLVRRMQGPSPLDTYRSSRDRARLQVAQTEQKSPFVDVAGVQVRPVAIAGAMAPSLGAGLPASWLGRVLASGATALIDETGASDADLTRGEAGDFAGDLGKASALGLGSGAAAELLGLPLRAAASGAAREAALAKDVVRQNIQASKDAAVRSATSSLGGITSAQGNAMETVLDVMRSPHMYSPEAQNAAWALTQSPEGKQLLSRAALNNMERFPALFGREAAARQVLGDAVSAAAPGVVAGEAAAKTLPSNVLSDTAGKFGRSIGQRAALGAAGAAVGAGLGEVTGGDWKTWAGVGGLGGAGLAPGSLQFMRNTAKNPAAQAAANEVAGKAFGAAAGRILSAARALEPAGAQTRTSNAFSEMARRFGLTPRSEEEMADAAYLAGQQGE